MTHDTPWMWTTITMVRSLDSGTAPVHKCVNHRGRAQDGGGEDEKEGKDEHGLDTYTYKIMIVMAMAPLSSSDLDRKFGHGFTG